MEEDVHVVPSVFVVFLCVCEPLQNASQRQNVCLGSVRAKATHDTVFNRAKHQLTSFRQLEERFPTSAVTKMVTEKCFAK